MRVVCVSCACGVCLTSGDGGTDKACDEIAKYGADYLVVSLGFDTFCEDLISNFKLTEPYYETMAAIVSARLPGLPALIVGEGGWKS